MPRPWGVICEHGTVKYKCRHCKNSYMREYQDRLKKERINVQVSRRLYEQAKEITPYTMRRTFDMMLRAYIREARKQAVKVRNTA